jgi:hypothetical protein
MVSEQELVGLLHRADWTKLTLSGTVRGPVPVTDSDVVVAADEPLSSPGTLSVAPGRRFRAEAADGAWAAEMLPDEVLHLVYRSGLTGPAFSATLHQWSDGGAMLAAIPQSMRDWGFGGVGFLVDTWMRDPDGEAGGVHTGSWPGTGKRRCWAARAGWNNCSSRPSPSWTPRPGWCSG